MRNGRSFKTLTGGLWGTREGAECHAEYVARQGFWLEKPERTLIAPAAIESLTPRQILE
jgi:hypothetical protein